MKREKVERPGTLVMKENRHPRFFGLFEKTEQGVEENRTRKSKKG